MKFKKTINSLLEKAKDKKIFKPKQVRSTSEDVLSAAPPADATRSASLPIGEPAPKALDPQRPTADPQAPPKSKRKLFGLRARRPKARTAVEEGTVPPPRVKKRDQLVRLTARLEVLAQEVTRRDGQVTMLQKQRFTLMTCIDELHSAFRVCLREKEKSDSRAATLSEELDEARYEQRESKELARGLAKELRARSMEAAQSKGALAKARRAESEWTTTHRKLEKEADVARGRWRAAEEDVDAYKRTPDDVQLILGVDVVDAILGMARNDMVLRASVRASLLAAATSTLRPFRNSEAYDGFTEMPPSSSTPRRKLRRSMFYKPRAREVQDVTQSEYETSLKSKPDSLRGAIDELLDAVQASGASAKQQNGSMQSKGAPSGVSPSHLHQPRRRTTAAVPAAVNSVTAPVQVVPATPHITLLAVPTPSNEVHSSYALDEILDDYIGSDDSLAELLDLMNLPTEEMVPVQSTAGTSTASIGVQESRSSAPSDSTTSLTDKSGSSMLGGGSGSNGETSLTSTYSGIGEDDIEGATQRGNLSKSAPHIMFTSPSIDDSPVAGASSVHSPAAGSASNTPTGERNEDSSSSEPRDKDLPSRAKRSGGFFGAASLAGPSGSTSSLTTGNEGGSATVRT